MAAVDVYDDEPVVDTQHPLPTMDVDQIAAYCAGAPINVVNPQVLD